MKIHTYLPAIKPGLVLALVNITLSTVFAVSVGVALAGTAIIEDLWGLPLPLLPLVVLTFVPVSIIAWAVYAGRIRQERATRFVTAAIGTLPLLGIAAAASLGLLWIVALPGMATTAPLAMLVITVLAIGAAAACAACVVWLRLPAKTD